MEQIEGQFRRLVSGMSSYQKLYAICTAYEKDRLRGLGAEAQRGIFLFHEAIKGLSWAAERLANTIRTQCGAGNRHQRASAVASRCEIMADDLWEIKTLAFAEDMPPRALMDELEARTLGFQHH